MKHYETINGKMVFSTPGDKKITASGENADFARGKALSKIMKAINGLERKANINETDFSEFLD